MIKFGTGGWRAFIGEEFTKDNVRLVAQAVANITNNESVADRGFVIGYDRRFLSDSRSLVCRGSCSKRHRGELYRQVCSNPYRDVSS